MSDRHDDANPADLAEQAMPLDEVEEVEVDDSDLEVDDADRWEQATPVGFDDDEGRDRG